MSRGCRWDGGFQRVVRWRMGGEGWFQTFFLGDYSGEFIGDKPFFDRRLKCLIGGENQQSWLNIYCWWFQRYLGWLVDDKCFAEGLKHQDMVKRYG